MIWLFATVSFLERRVHRLEQIDLLDAADACLVVIWLLLPYDSIYITNRDPFYLCYFAGCFFLIIVKVYNAFFSFFANGQCLFLPYILNDSCL